MKLFGFDCGVMMVGGFSVFVCMLVYGIVFDVVGIWFVFIGVYEYVFCIVVDVGV